LGKRLVEISEALLNLTGKTAIQVFGWTDQKKLRSCMTLFSIVPGADRVFQDVLDKYFGGEVDRRSIRMIDLGDKNSESDKHNP